MTNFEKQILDYFELGDNVRKLTITLEATKIPVVVVELVGPFNPQAKVFDTSIKTFELKEIE